MRFILLILIFICLFSACAYPLFTESELESIAKAMFVKSISFIIESFQVLMILEDYRASYSERVETSSIEIKNVHIYYNKDKFELSSLTKAILEGMVGESTGKFSEEENKKIKQKCITEYKKEYPNFDKKAYLDKKYRFKLIKLKSGDSFEAHGFGGISGEAKLGEKATKGEESDFELVTVSSFDDKNNTLPSAKVAFILFDKGKNRKIESKILWLDKENDLWRVRKTKGSCTYSHPHTKSHKES